MITTPQEAYELLARLGASPRLLRHLELVGEAGEALISCLTHLGVPFDPQWVRLGIAVHDAGKIMHPEELSGPGSKHEPAGEALLLANGVEERVARCCVSHARYTDISVSLEELLVALADKLWKGKRVAELEDRVIDAVAILLNNDRWDIFGQLDDRFELIASSGDERLVRSRTW